MDSKQKQWLLKVHPNLKWSLKGPNIQNPFDSAVADQKLEDYASDRQLLKEICQVTAIMDETKIITITNLDHLQFESDHPNVVGLDREQFDQYLREAGVWNLIDDQIKKFQNSCVNELDRRRAPT